MQIGEACDIARIAQHEPQCNPPQVSTENWEAVIDGIKGVGSAKILRDNMIAAKETPPSEPRELEQGWDLFACNRNTFPYQTHHLIPEKQLPYHKITNWLTDSPKDECRNKDYKLAGDTNYDTNGARNGYFMPFASTTHQWKKKSSKKMRRLVCFEMMRRTKIQLHQGRHSKTEDHLEKPDLEGAPYKEQVAEFLGEIDVAVTTHVKDCPICKSGKEKPYEVAPLLSTVKMIEQASQLMKTLLLSCRAVVSERAGDYINANWQNGRLKHPKISYVTENDYI